jgi:hypothetical protein
VNRGMSNTTRIITYDNGKETLRGYPEIGLGKNSRLLG